MLAKVFEIKSNCVSYYIYFRILKKEMDILILLR